MDYSFIREDFVLNSISKSILSIQLSLDGFSFVITSAENQQNPDYIFISHLEKKNWDELVLTLADFRGFDLKEFYAIRIMVHEPNFALVPDNLFDLTDMKAYLKINHPPRINSKALSNRILIANAVCVFSIHQGLYDLLRKKFPGADFCHTSLPFCNMALNSNIDGCFVQRYEKSLELAVVKNNKLEMYNIFEVSNDNDLTFFILSAYKSAGLNLNQHLLTVAGIQAKDSEALNQVHKYIKNINFYCPEYLISSENTIPEYPSHYFINHREIINCAL